MEVDTMTNWKSFWICTGIGVAASLVYYGACYGINAIEEAKIRKQEAKKERAKKHPDVHYEKFNPHRKVDHNLIIEIKDYQVV